MQAQFDAGELITQREVVSDDSCRLGVVTLLAILATAVERQQQ